MTTITLRNDFHHTTCTVRLPAEAPRTLSAGQARRVRRVLCGVEGCGCGGPRGPQDDGLQLLPILIRGRLDRTGHRVDVETWDVLTCEEYRQMMYSAD